MNQLPTNDSIGIAMDLRCDPPPFSNILLSFSKGLLSSCLPGTSTSPLSGMWWRFQRRGMRNIILAARFDQNYISMLSIWQTRRLGACNKDKDKDMNTLKVVSIIGALSTCLKAMIYWMVCKTEASLGGKDGNTPVLVPFFFFIFWRLFKFPFWAALCF